MTDMTIRQEARRLYLDEAKSASEVGRALGVTRNVIIGWARAWPAKGKPEPKKAVTMPKVSKPPAPPPSPKAKPPTAPETLRPDVIRCTPRPYLSFPKGCKWIVSGRGADSMVCANPRDPEEPYCAGHMRLAHQAPKTSAKEFIRSLRRLT